MSTTLSKSVLSKYKNDILFEEEKNKDELESSLLNFWNINKSFRSERLFMNIK